MTLLIFLLLQVLLAIKQNENLLDFSKFFGNPNFDVVMKYIFRKPEE